MMVILGLLVGLEGIRFGYLVRFPLIVKFEYVYVNWYLWYLSFLAQALEEEVGPCHLLFVSLHVPSF